MITLIGFNNRKIEIADEINWIERYIHHPRNYIENYDKKHSETDTITDQDIHNARSFGARSSISNINKTILQSRDIPQLLKNIPKKINLHELENDKWDRLKKQLEELFRPLVLIHGVGFPVAAKLLHLKRPQLIPIISKEITEFFYNKPEIPKTKIEKTIELITLIQKNIKDNLPAFEALKRYWDNKGYDFFTVLRLFDILIWIRYQDRW